MKCQIYLPLVILTLAVLMSCNNLPVDLQIRKDNCNAKLKELSAKDANPNSTEYKYLLKEYIELKAEAISYTADCNKRGFYKENDKLIKELDDKISKYQKLANSIDEIYSRNSTNETTSSCSICGQTFSGRGYEEISNGVWEQCTYPHSSQICSPSCGMRHTNKMNDIINSVNNGERCSWCGLGHYQNGYCDRCGAASKQRANQSREKMPVCPICHGTGVEMPQGANIGGETGRICPGCNGSGHESY